MTKSITTTNVQATKLWYLKSLEEVISDLNSSKKGLTEALAKQKLETDGPNTIAQEEKGRMLKILFRNFNSILIYVLLMASLISLFADHLLEFIVIMVIIFATGISGFIQEYNAGKALDALSKLTVKYVYVLRDGVKKKIKSEDLVVGDLIFFDRGIIIPADIRVFEANNLSVNESILTGESVLKYKKAEVLTEQDIFITEQHNMLFSGTSITNGHGFGMVVSTGLASEIGKISTTLKKIGDKPSPLQKKIDSMGKKLSLIVLFICVFLFTILISRGVSMFDTLLLVSAVAVSGIPECFPLALTMSLTNGVKRMAKNNALIKDLNSVETLGTCTVICTDKTGTLTENKMVAEKIYFAHGLEVISEGKEYEPTGKFTFKDKKINKEKLKAYLAFFKCCVLCNNAETQLKENEWILFGEPTEGAILTLAKSAGFEEQALRENNPRIFEIPFDPFDKYMLTINEDNSKKTKIRVANIKGAAEKILSKCSFIRTSTGKTTKIKKSDLERITKQMHQYTNQTYRVLAIASKTIHKKTLFKSKKDLSKLVSNFIFEGLIAIDDPVRPEVFKSIEECKTANVKVMMITGDHKDTAMSVGKKLGLISTPKDLVLEGMELDKMTDDELDDIISHVSIFSRTTPDHKFRIVNSLQRKGEIVAMTGDGVNDAPALKTADIGVAMGKSGTDVAREASNMVLMDDNFSTIVNAIKEGRTIYSNIRRFVYYLLTGNMTEVFLILFTALLGLLTPLTAIMILFINVVTSTLPAMALSIEPTHPKVMNQTPRNAKEGLLSKYILLKIFSLVPVLFIGTLALFLWEINIAGMDLNKARTMAFATLILFELFHTFNSRSLHSTIFNKTFFNNKYIFIAVGLSVSLTLLTIHTAIGQMIFGTTSLNGFEWLTIILISSSIVVVSELIKALINSELKEQHSLNFKSRN